MRRWRGRAAPRPYFLFVGRLEKIKGLDDVIPLFRNYPDADLLIAGDGEYAPTLKVAAAGIDNVRFLGRVAPDELRRYYQHAIALIVPSVCFETFGIILIEAFKQSTPVIARRIGPFPEIVDRAEGESFSPPGPNCCRPCAGCRTTPAIGGRGRNRRIRLLWPITARARSFRNTWISSNAPPFGVT